VVDAYEKLTAGGTKARVVSLPSWFRFELQDKGYKDSVIPPATKARLAVEMGGSMGWDRYVGSHGDTITMSTFGASAPLAKLADKFGFTVDNVVAKAKALIAEAASTDKE
jgi:transketolase